MTYDQTKLMAFLQRRPLEIQKKKNYNTLTIYSVKIVLNLYSPNSFFSPSAVRSLLQDKK